MEQPDFFSKLFPWFSAGRQKQIHKIGHTGFTVQPWKKLVAFF